MRSSRWDGLIRLALFIGFLVGAAHWLDFFWRPFEAYYDEHRSVGSVFLELLKPRNDIYPAPLQGYLFIIFTIALFIGLVAIGRAISDYIVSQRVGVSILETSIRLEFDDSTWRTGRSVRKQLLHANRLNVGAYHFGHFADHGKIDRNSLLVSSHIGSRKMTKSIMTLARSPRSLEVTEIFNSALPTSVFATYLPDSVVLALFRLGIAFRNIVVERNTCIDYADEYSIGEPVFQLTAQRYPVTNASITLVFPPNCAPPPTTVLCYVIADSLVETLEPKIVSENGKVCFVFDVGKLSQARARVTWLPGPGCGPHASPALGTSP